MSSTQVRSRSMMLIGMALAVFGGIIIAFSMIFASGGASINDSILIYIMLLVVGLALFIVGREPKKD